MANSSQNFIPDLAFLYGTVYTGTSRTPDFRLGSTDWNRRAVELPVISKEIEHWSGQFNVGEVSFGLADVDGSVTGTLYPNGTYPFGKTVAIYEKISDNPAQFMNVFTGQVTSTEKVSGLVRVSCEDSLRNILNAQFTPDYVGLATTISGATYGVVKDVIGSNVYLDDLGDIKLIKIQHKSQSNGGGLWSALAGIVGFAVGFAVAPTLPWIAGLAGLGLSSITSAIEANNPGQKNTQESYYRVTDYNAIPDYTIFGGQTLKFAPGTVDGRANGVSGSLYNIKPAKVKGGTFVNGLYGTIELDNSIDVPVFKGDSIYVELPVFFRGSPDDILVNMLTGSNSTIRYSYPNDFSEDWVAQTVQLRHIDAYSAIKVNDSKVDINSSIGQLAKEFGFTFYVDEANRFAVCADRIRNVYGSDLNGTLSEGYNVIGEGFKKTQDVKTSFTDLTVNYRVADGLYQNSVTSTLNTQYSNIRRNLTIDSQWMHDGYSARAMSKRYSRRAGSVLSKITADVSMYSVPFLLGEIISCTGWSVGTGQPFEITKYTKDYNSNKASIEGEDASRYFQRGFFVLGTGGTVNGSSLSGFATQIVQNGTTNYGGFYVGAGNLNGTFSQYESKAEIIAYGGASTPVLPVDGLIRFGTFEEILKVRKLEALTVWVDPDPSLSFTTYEIHLDRAQLNTIPLSNLTIDVFNPPNTYIVSTVYATVINYGTSFMWY